MYHTIGIWSSAPAAEVTTLFQETALTHTSPNGDLVSLTKSDTGAFEVIRQWLTLEDATKWVEFSEANNITSVTIVKVPE
jgi:hypothetical protein